MSIRVAPGPALRPQHAVAAQRAVLVEVIEHGRQAHREHLPPDRSEQFGQEAARRSVARLAGSPAGRSAWLPIGR
jgi:hypothetical protein